MSAKGNLTQRDVIAYSFSAPLESDTPIVSDLVSIFRLCRVVGVKQAYIRLMASMARERQLYAQRERVRSELREALGALRESKNELRETTLALQKNKDGAIGEQLKAKIKLLEEKLPQLDAEVERLSEEQARLNNWRKPFDYSTRRCIWG